MPNSYQVTIAGRWSWFGVVPACPACGTDCGLTFSTDPDMRHVTGSCPASHVWDEQRIPGTAVRRLTIETGGGRQ